MNPDTDANVQMLYDVIEQANEEYARRGAPDTMFISNELAILYGLICAFCENTGQIESIGGRLSKCGCDYEIYPRP